jgi:hypothetical protein
MAFIDCYDLTGVYFQGDAPSIGASVFDNDTNAIAYYLPYTEGWTGPTFGGLPLMSWPGMEAAIFLYITNNGTITITRYIGPGGTAVIPDQTNGYSVTSIGTRAFGYNTNLIDIVIGRNVTNAGSSYVPGAHIGPFALCFGLQAITVDTNNPVYSSSAGVLYDRSRTALLEYPLGKTGSYTIPDGVRTIGETAFSFCNGLSSILMPTSLTNIADMAFYKCVSLTNATIGPNVTSIEYYAFLGTSLTGVYFLGDAPSLGPSAFDFDANAIAYYLPYTEGWTGPTFGGLPIMPWPGTEAAYFTCTTNNGAITITGYTGPGGTAVIPSTINGYSVTSIGAGAFGYNTNLINVMIGRSVTNAGSGPFALCFGLQAITVDTNNPLYSSPAGVLYDRSRTTLLEYPAGKTGSYTIPDGVGTIGEAAFQHCNGLTSILMPTSLTNIAGGAFYQCVGLTNATIGPNVTSIGADAFSNCGSLVSANLPNGITSIDFYTFYGCGSLTKMTIPAGVRFIGDSAFSECASLTSLTIPPCAIDNLAFSYCSGLTNVTLAEGVSGIGDYAFAWCSGLAGLTLPSTVTSIGDAAFEASGLTSVVIPYGITSIGPSTFGGCPGLTNVMIPNTVGMIGNTAFGSCGMTTITIPKSVSRIDDMAFTDCDHLTGIYFEGGAPSLGTSVFDGDTNATVYYMPGTIGWGPTFGGRPAVLWNPQAAESPNFGVRTNRFGFTITGSSNLVIVVEACTNLTRPDWSVVATNTLTSGACYFCDPHWTNYPGRYYRFRSP